MEVYHVRARAAQHGHRPLHRVRYIAELEVEEYAVSPRLYLPDDVRTLGVEELHADLHIRPLGPEHIEKGQRVLPGREVAGDYHVLSHCVRLL